MTKPTIFTWTRRASVVSVVLIGLAMLAYPGGTSRDPLANGYSVFQNFLSDLLSTVTWGGQHNRIGATLAVLGFAILAVALGGCALALVGLYSSSPKQKYVARAAGVAAVFACVGLFGAALTPPNRFIALHLQFATLAIGGGVVACLLFALGASRDDRFSKGVTVGWLVLALILGALFSMRWGPSISTDRGLTIQVTFQKFAALAIVVIFIYQGCQADRVAARISEDAV